MALIGLYVGVIPVAIGMLWLPWLRRIDPRWIQFLLALTLGLLVFLAVDAVLEGVEFASGWAQAFGGPLLVILGALLSYAILAGIGNQLNAEHRRVSGVRYAAPGFRLAFLVALGIGLHNLGEGLAIGSAYAIGSPFDRIAISPDNATAIAYFSAAGPDASGFFRNPNELAVVDPPRPRGVGITYPAQIHVTDIRQQCESAFVATLR